jgi:hypothetical protein
MAPDTAFPRNALDGMKAVPPPVLHLHLPLHLNLTLNFNPPRFGASGQGGTKIKIRIKNEDEGKKREAGQRSPWNASRLWECETVSAGLLVLGS